MTEIVLNSHLARRFSVIHADTSDHRGIDSVGRFDLHNVWLAFRHALAFLVLLRYRPDLVYVPIAQTRLGFLRDALFLLAARASRVPRVIVHFHGQGFGEFYRGESAWVRSLVRASLRRRTHAIVLGKTLTHEFADVLSRSHIHVLANGIDDIRVLYETGPDSSAVLFLSHLGVRKGVFEFLRAAGEVVERVPGARFTLAGEWYREDEHRRGQRLIKELRLDGCIDEIGLVSETEKPRVLADAALLVLPSPAEGQPLVLLEALAAGVPVVATKVGAIPETIDDGVEGFLVEFGDLSTLTDRICRLLQDPELRAKMGVAARSRFERDYTAEIFASKLEQIWCDVLGGEVGRG